MDRLGQRQTRINLLFKIGWVYHERLSRQSRSIAFQNQPSWMESRPVLTLPGFLMIIFA